LLAEEIAAPLGLDLWIWLPKAEQHRVSRIVDARLTSAHWPGSTWTPSPSPCAT
jgi:hypothetical protein